MEKQMLGTEVPRKYMEVKIKFNWYKSEKKKKISTNQKWNKKLFTESFSIVILNWFN